MKNGELAPLASPDITRISNSSYQRHNARISIHIECETCGCRMNEWAGQYSSGHMSCLCTEWVINDVNITCIQLKDKYDDRFKKRFKEERKLNMVKIFKYPVSITDSFTLDMPKGADILSFQIQEGNPYIWALVNPEAEIEKRTFRLAGTGHPIEELPLDLFFIGTVQMVGGNLVWHLFEVIQR